MKINFAKVPIPLSKVFIMNIKKLFIYLFCALSFAFTYETALSQNIKIEIENDKEISVIEAFDLVKKSTDYSLQNWRFSECSENQIKQRCYYSKRIVNRVSCFQ